MINYLKLAKEILKSNNRTDRTGTGTRSIFGTRLEFDLNEGFPLLTTKKVHFKSIAVELLWFLRGETNIKFLKENGVSIWDEWATEEGEIGPMYGTQFVNWGRQLELLIKNINERPTSRRHVLSTWNVDLLPDESISPQENVKNGKMALAPCHILTQFYITGDKISCQFYMRSIDFACGLPFNVASYALLTHMIGQQCSLKPDKLIFVGGDTHIYQNHIDGITEQMKREPLPLPKLELNKKDDIFSYELSDIQLTDYHSHDKIYFPISV